MFKGYLELLKSLFENVFNNGENIITLKDYLLALFYSFSIILIVLLGILLLYLVFLFPKTFYDKLIKSDIVKINELVKKSQTTLIADELKTIKENINKLNKKVSKLKIFYIVFLVFIYVPIVFPLILILLDIFINKIV